MSTRIKVFLAKARSSRGFLLEAYPSYDSTRVPSYLLLAFESAVKLQRCSRASIASYVVYIG